MKIPEIQKNMYRENYVKKYYNEFYTFLLEKYPHIELHRERVYLYLNNLDEPPKCPICGNTIKYKRSPAGYNMYCSKQCLLQGDRVEKTKNTKLERYGNPSYNNPEKTKQTCLEKYGVENPLASQKIKDKYKQTCLKRYGVENVSYSKEIQNKISEKLTNRGDSEKQKSNNKRKQTCLERYGVENPMQNLEIQKHFEDTMMDRYGVKYAMQNKNLSKRFSESLIQTHASGQYIQKHRENNSFNISKIEKQFEQYLIDNNYNYIYQYHSEKYPFNCDFYLYDYDLYIEIQGSWTHGLHPFNPEDPNDIKKLNLWKSKTSKFYKNAIYVWTDLDVRKREMAKQNNINLLEIFSIKPDIVIDIFNQKINQLKNE